MGVRSFCALAARLALVLAFLIGWAVATYAQVPGDSLILQGDFIRTGISNNGTLGVGGSISPGFIFDASGTGTFSPANDYLTPGIPFEGFSLSYTGSGGVKANNNAGNTVQIGAAAAPTVFSSPDFDHALRWVGTIPAVLTIENIYGLDDNGKQVSITTTITALTDLSALQFGRWIDPDSGGTTSINSRGNSTLGLAPEDFVTSVSATNGATLGFFSNSAISHNTAIVPFPWSTNPAVYIAGSGNTTGDDSIGLGFNIGSLLNGNSVVLEYSYVVAADPNDFGSLLGAWTGTVDSTFSLAANWDPPQVAASGELVRVESHGNASLNHNVTGNTYSGWEFTADSAQVTVSGNTVSLGDGATLKNASSHVQSFTTAVATAGNLTIDAQANGVALQNLQVANGATVTVNTGTTSASSVAGVISGTGSSLTKTGAGTLTLSGSSENTNTGTTTVSGGTLVLNKAAGGAGNDFGSAVRGNLVINSGATVQEQAGAQIADSSTVTLNGGTLNLGNSDDSVGRVIMNNGGQVTGAGANAQLGFDTSQGVQTTGTGAATISTKVSLESGSPADQNDRVFDVGANAPLAVSGNIASGNDNTAGLVKTGPGTLTLAGANTYTGGTTVSAGTLKGNTTSLQGNITNNSTVAFDQTTNGAYAGNMGGSGSLQKLNSGSVTLTGTNTYAGGTTVSAGTLQGAAGSLRGNITNNATTVFDQPSDGAWSGGLTGNGALTKTGPAALNYTGNGSAYTGTTSVTQGRLAVNNSLGGNVTVGASGTLSGAGTIGGNVNNQGTVAAGNSIGTLAMSSYTSSAGSVTQVEINAAGNTPGTNVDRLNVSGTATLGGGTVDVRAAAGSYAVGTQYTFLTAGSVSGAFDGISDDLQFFDADLGYTASSVFFTLSFSATDFESHGGSTNQRSVGGFIDHNSAGATGDFADLLMGLLSLPEQDALKTLNQLSGAVHGSLGQIGVENTTLYLQTLSRRLRSGVNDGDDMLASSGDAAGDVVLVSYDPSAESPVMIQGMCGPRRNWNTWATGFGLGGSAQSDGNAAGLNYSLGGGLTGMETMDDTHLLGLYGGYIGSNVGTDVNESANVNGATTGMYIVGRRENHYYIVAGGCEFDDLETHRQIALANATADGSTDGWKGYSYVERGVTLCGQQLALQPFAGLQYVYVRQDGFRETGGGVANLDVSGINTHSLRSVLGSRVYGRNLGSSGRAIAPEFRALWLHEFLDTNSAFSADLTTVGGRFTVNGLGLGRDWALLGTGLNCQLGRGWSTYADYDLMLNGQQVFHVGSGGVSKSW